MQYRHGSSCARALARTLARALVALWSRFGRALACALCHVLIMHTHLLCTRGFLMKAHQNLESNAQHIVLRQPCEMTNLNEAMINIGSRMPFTHIAWYTKYRRVKVKTHLSCVHGSLMAHQKWGSNAHHIVLRQPCE